MNISVLSCRTYCIFWHTSEFSANMMFPEHWLTLQGWQEWAEKSRPRVLKPSRLQQNTNSSTQQPKSSELCSYFWNLPLQKEGFWWFPLPFFKGLEFGGYPIFLLSSQVGWALPTETVRVHVCHESSIEHKCLMVGRAHPTLLNPIYETMYTS